MSENPAHMHRPCRAPSCTHARCSQARQDRCLKMFAACRPRRPEPSGSAYITALFTLLARQHDGCQQQLPLSDSEPPDHLAIGTSIQLHPSQLQPMRCVPAPSEPASLWPPSSLARCPVLKSCATVRARAHANGQLTVCARVTLGCARLRNCADGVQAGGPGERKTVGY